MIWRLYSENRISEFEKNGLFSFKIRLFKCISGQITEEICNKKNLYSVFSKIGLKMSMGRVPPESFGVSEFLCQEFVKKNFEVRNLKSQRFWVFFQKSILKIFANFA